MAHREREETELREQKKPDQIRLASRANVFEISSKRNERSLNCIKHVCRIFFARV